MSRDLKHAQALDQFFTPPALAKEIVGWADIKPKAKILEPSCGVGNLVRWMPRDAQVTALDIDPDVFDDWDEEARDRWGMGLDPVCDFLQYRAASDAYDMAIMNPPYGYVGSGKMRQAADRLHVQHALRMCPEVICHVRANFLWGTERWNHVMRFVEVVKMAVLVHRPSYHGPAVTGSGGHHEMAVYHLRRCEDRMLRKHKADSPELEFWTQDWRLAA